MHFSRSTAKTTSSVSMHFTDFSDIVLVKLLQNTRHTNKQVSNIYSMSQAVIVRM